MHYDFLTIGGGSGGIASVNRAAKYGAKCAVIESKDIGGTCVNAGCVPKKVMWHAAQISEAFNLYASSYGFSFSSLNFDWSTMVESRDKYIDRINSAYLSGLESNGVDVFYGRGRFLEKNKVEIEGKTISADHILIATGCRPIFPKIPGANLGISSDDFFKLKTMPRKVAIIGAGYIAVELAGVMNALGSFVHIFVRNELPLRSFDKMLSESLVEFMCDHGINFHKNSTPRELSKNENGGISVHFLNGEKHDFDCVVWAVGREPNTTDLCLSAAGVEQDSRGYISVDKYQNTNVDGIYAVGDVTGMVELTPVAVAVGRCLSDRLFNNNIEAHVDCTNVPTVVFSHPPIGAVGLTEFQARSIYGDKKIKIYQTKFYSMYTSITNNRQLVRMKIVCMGEDEKVVGLHGIGYGMDEILQGFAVAFNIGLTKRDLDRSLAIHPTVAEEFVTMK